ncbi:MAG: 3-isopropylmalate dehydratase large subunit [Phycisphaerae bacterium]|nr:3-isopropylmalate dehydratase large subunit [Phycisphaerae bacterium]
MGQTLVEKIAQRYAIGSHKGHTVRAGDYLSVRPAHLMTHDNTAAVIPKFTSMGAKKVFDPQQPVFCIDHDIQNISPENLATYAKIEQFARQQGIAFFGVGRGIGHQVMVEEGFVLPGTLVVGSDSHSNLYGALGALGTPVVRTDAAAIWATGRTWWQVPPVVRVQLTGQLQPGVSGKDVIIALCGFFNHDEVLNCALEFTGPGASHLTIEERMSISNMTTEWGALVGIFPYDRVTHDYLLQRAAVMSKRGDSNPRLTPDIIKRIETELPTADQDATYFKEITLDLSTVIPHVSGPNEVKTMTPLPEIEKQQLRVNRAYILSCVNGRLQDFAEAAKVIGNRKVADGVKLYIAAASSEVQAEAIRMGYWPALINAGAIELPPGCGPCIGLGDGVLQDGEIGISATNRNFQGRMGSPKARCFLASPVVVAASAVAGMISAQADAAWRKNAGAIRGSVRAEARGSESKRAAVNILPGFPAAVEGELLWIAKDNLNTDGIYGKDYTYKQLPADEMGKVAMLNYDPQFQNIARQGDVMVGGYNFGTGSSREQAATALKFRGIALVLAGSFSETYKRNAFNNGYVCIECPELVDDLKKTFAGDKTLTLRTGWMSKIDFSRSQIVVQRAVVLSPRVSNTTTSASETKVYTFSPLGEVAQELVIKGGFENVIREQIAAL